MSGRNVPDRNEVIFGPALRDLPYEVDQLRQEVEKDIAVSQVETESKVAEIASQVTGTGGGDVITNITNVAGTITEDATVVAPSGSTGTCTITSTGQTVTYQNGTGTALYSGDTIVLLEKTGGGWLAIAVTSRATPAPPGTIVVPNVLTGYPVDLQGAGGDPFHMQGGCAYDHDGLLGFGKYSLFFGGSTANTIYVFSGETSSLTAFSSPVVASIRTRSHLFYYDQYLYLLYRETDQDNVALKRWSPSGGWSAVLARTVAPGVTGTGPARVSRIFKMGTDDCLLFGAINPATTVNVRPNKLVNLTAGTITEFTNVSGEFVIGSGTTWWRSGGTNPSWANPINSATPTWNATTIPLNPSTGPNPYSSGWEVVSSSSSTPPEDASGSLDVTNNGYLFRIHSKTSGSPAVSRIGVTAYNTASTLVIDTYDLFGTAALTNPALFGEPWAIRSVHVLGANVLFIAMVDIGFLDPTRINKNNTVYQVPAAFITDGYTVDYIWSPDVSGIPDVSRSVGANTDLRWNVSVGIDGDAWGILVVRYDGSTLTYSTNIANAFSP